MKILGCILNCNYILIAGIVLVIGFLFFFHIKEKKKIRLYYGKFCIENNKLADEFQNKILNIMNLEKTILDDNPNFSKEELIELGLDFKKLARKDKEQIDLLDAIYFENEFRTFLKCKEFEVFLEQNNISRETVINFLKKHKYIPETRIVNKFKSFKDFKNFDKMLDKTIKFEFFINNVIEKNQERKELSNRENILNKKYFS